MTEINPYASTTTGASTRKNKKVIQSFAMAFWILAVAGKIGHTVFIVFSEDAYPATFESIAILTSYLTIIVSSCFISGRIVGIVFWCVSGLGICLIAYLIAGWMMIQHSGLNGVF